MIHDLADSPLPNRKALTCDVCIAGAGPAGIALGLSLARQRPDWHIVLLEAGGRQDASERERAIFRVDQSGRDYTVLDISRRRKLGGTTAHWGGWSKPLDESDYEDNPAFAVPAWPLGPADLRPYYDRASEWCELGGQDFDPAPVLARDPGRALATEKLGSIGTRLFRFSPPTRFGSRYEDELASADNLTCLLHANVTGFGRRGDRITAARVATLAGDRLEINAQHFVLAMGGMETTRHLLHLRGDGGEDGHGVHSPHLGRYFADHFGFGAAQLLAPAELRYHMFSDGGERLMPVLAFTPAVLRAEQQNNSCLRLYATGADDSLPAGYARQAAFGFEAREYWNYEVKITVEPRPNPESRLRLGSDRCELGMRRLDLSWQIDPADFDSAYTLLERLGQECGAAGLGRLKLTRPNSPELRNSVSGGCHHMGTARMARDPDDGVTDPHARVFDTANLHIASSAVFPRYGYSNPTLTIVALALRLADRLAGAGA